MTTEELSVFIQKWFCGCGNPETALGYLQVLLSAAPYHTGDKLDYIVSPNSKYFTLYTLDHFGLIEHGGSVGGAWLTKKGEDVRIALIRESTDGYRTLLKMRCVHGVDIDKHDPPCQECRKACEEWRHQ